MAHLTKKITQGTKKSFLAVRATQIDYYLNVSGLLDNVL